MVLVIVISTHAFSFEKRDILQQESQKIGLSEVLVSTNPKGKLGAAFGSYGWSGEAPILIAEKMREMGMTVIDPVLRILHKPTDKDVQECKRLGIDIAEKLKQRRSKTS